MPTDDDRYGVLAPDDGREDQSERDDLIEPDEIDAEPVDEPTLDEETGELPSSEDLPESQGADVLESERLAEDATPRRLLSDEEAERG